MAPARATSIHPRVDTEKACETDDIALMKTALEASYSSEPVDYFREKITNSISMATQHRAMKILQYLLEAYPDSVSSIQPGDLVTKRKDYTHYKFSLPSIQLLDLLHRHHYDINGIGLQIHKSGPLLWRVCSSSELIQWCLDHGAEVVLAEETTSTNPAVANIYHSPRRPLLLEVVAAIGSVVAFKKLSALGAPLVPGPGWPKWHAPRVLHDAVLAATLLAPYGKGEPANDYAERLSMIDFLIDEVKLDVNGIGGDINAVLHSSWPQFDISYPPYKDRNIGRNIGAIVSHLLDRGADVDLVAGMSFEDTDLLFTPLGCVKWKNEGSFRGAVSSWQKKNPRRAIITNRCKLLFPNLRSIGSTKGLRCLTDLPHEILVMIGSLLQVEDLRNIRLTNRAVSISMFESFRYFIGRKKYSLDKESISELIEQYHTGGLPIYLDELQFCSAEAGSAQDTQSLLTQLFNTATSYKRLKALDVLTATGHEIDSIFKALNSSSLVLQSLSLYRNAGKLTGRMDLYRELRDSMDLTTAFSTIRHLTWSLAIDKDPANISEPVPKDIQQANVAAVKHMLTSMPLLATIDLFWYKFYPSGTMESSFFESCLEPMLAMVKLKEARLSGMYVTEASLSTFLQHTTAKRIHLHEIKQRDGRCQTILDILTSGRFEFFHIDDLYEIGSSGRYKLIRLHAPEKVKTRTHLGSYGPSKIRREGPEASRPLSYGFPTGRTMGRHDARMLSAIHMEKYGSDGG